MRQFVLVLAAVLVACSRHPADHRQIVGLLDMTASVTVQARASSLDAIRQAVHTLQRGDTLVIVPIATDAQLDAPQHILRFHVPVDREPYDADRERFRDDIEARLAALAETTRKTPATHTDLLGTFRLAAEEVAMADPKARRSVVCLSDFIQDDDQFDFKTDQRVATDLHAQRLAAMLATANPQRFAHVPVFLGSLPSIDLRRLSKSRRDALRAFWRTYLTGQGATVEWATDGAGKLPVFLETLDARWLNVPPTVAASGHERTRIDGVR
jgi:acetyl-CoA acetyltransferase